MAFIIWNNSYSVGIDAFDADHIIMMSLINHLYDARQEGRDAAVIGAILAALFDYVDHHFQKEEALLEEARFPGLADHREEHAQLARRVEELQKTYETGSREDLADDLLEMLKSWLTDHIMVVDMKYRDFFAAAGA